MRFLALSALLITSFANAAAWSAGAPAATAMPSFELTIKNHKFIPQELSIPADQEVKLTIKNLDATTAEFESDDFQAEKAVPSEGEVSLYIPPLKPGKYGFYDDFHEDETRGTLLVVK